ncbi:MAG: diacylglycerol kinase family protein [bacterium]|nr:diacylglycerol kinase family protein [bacterium]
MKLFLVLNPTAQSGRAKRTWSTIFSCLRETGTSFNYRITEQPLDAVSFARQAISAGYDLVVAVGGDGTICEVVTGIMKGLEDARVTMGGAGETVPAVRFGVIYTGTSPDFNTYHKIPLDPVKAVDVLIHGTPTAIDVGRVVYCLSDLSGSVSDLERQFVSNLVHDDVVTEYFVGNVNVGIGPMVARKANTGYRRLLGDLLGTMSAVVGSFAVYRKTDFKLRLDGGDMVFDELINLTVGKNPFIASGMKVFSDIKPDDGRVAVLVVQRFSFLPLLANLPRLYGGTFLDHENVTVTYAQEVDIFYDREHPEVEFDGDPKGFLPARIDLISRGMEVMMPHDR